MPHLLPETDPAGEFECMLVYLPAGDEQHRRALMGQIERLGYWFTWERDPLKRGALMASAWKEAIALTNEERQMNRLQTIIDLETEIRDLLMECCTMSGVTYEYMPPVSGTNGNNDTVTINPVGPPSTVADPADSDTLVSGGTFPVNSQTDPDSGGTVTEAEFREYLCGAAAVILDALITWIRVSALVRRTVGNIVATLTDLAAYIIGEYVPTVGSVISIMDHIGAVALADLLNATTADYLDATADALQADRDAVINQLACADSASDALSVLQTVTAAASPHVSAAAFISGGVLPFLAFVLYEALIDATWSTDCECAGAYDFDLLYTFDADAEGWGGTYMGTYGNPAGCMGDVITTTSDESGPRITSGNKILTDAGEATGQWLAIDLVEFDIYVNPEWDDFVKMTVRLRTGGMQTFNLNPTPGEWVSMSIPLGAYDTWYEASAVDQRLEFSGRGLAGGTNNQLIRVDNVRVAGRVSVTDPGAL